VVVSLESSELAPSMRSLLGLNDEQALIRNWLIEESLTRIRWGAVPITLLLIPLFPSIPVSLVLSLAVLAGAGNVWIAWQLGGIPDVARLRSVRWGATCLDWATAIGSIYLLSPELTNRTPGLLLLLVFTMAFRFGQAGVRRRCSSH
jgi:hypothetical protein